MLFGKLFWGCRYSETLFSVFIVLYVVYLSFHKIWKRWHGHLISLPDRALSVYVGPMANVNLDYLYIKGMDIRTQTDLDNTVTDKTDKKSCWQLVIKNNLIQEDSLKSSHILLPNLEYYLWLSSQLPVYNLLQHGHAHHWMALGYAFSGVSVWT